ncbi:MAG: TspO/MBR family protein [Verrucomicrobiota bacterium]
MKLDNQWVVLGGFCVASFVAAAIGGTATGGAVQDWYPTLAKPSWTPPAWLFGPVWTLLYIAMAVAAWLVWRRVGWDGARLALLMFFIQLTLNAVWSVVFFGLRNPGAAFAEIVVLWVAIVVTTLLFWKVTPTAGWLFLPYLVWVSFATALNFAIWRLNS